MEHDWADLPARYPSHQICHRGFSDGSAPHADHGVGAEFGGMGAQEPLTYTHEGLGKASRKRDRRKKTPGYVTALKWAAGLSVVALMIYAAWDRAGVVYDADDIAVIDFSDLPSTSRRRAVQAANRARCNCGCGMTLAQCVATDSTCPVRETNIERIRTLVREARNTS